MLSLFFLINIISYYVVAIFFTQRIYSKNNFFKLFCFSLLFPLIVFLFFSKNSNLSSFYVASSFTFIYFLILLSIKIVYRKLNSVFIKLKVIPNKFSSKDFTYVNWNSNNTAALSWWNKTYAKKPSILDHFLTFLLLALPILLAILIHTLIVPNPLSKI